MHANFSNPSLAFDAAIAQGVLTNRTATDWMYMGNSPRGEYMFKHRITRAYIYVTMEAETVWA